MAVAWICFVKQKGLSPLMPGQWKAFLAYYAGMLGEISSEPGPMHAAGSPLRLKCKAALQDFGPFRILYGHCGSHLRLPWRQCLTAL